MPVSPWRPRTTRRSSSEGFAFPGRSAARQLVDQTASSRSITPLANRNFRALFAARFVSLLGDGAFLVALAWEAYTLSNAPTALSLLGIAMTVPLIALLLFGGVVSDRYDRRTVMLLADVVRAALLALLGVLAASGALRLWHMMVIVAIYGGAQAFFDPASDAILPEILPASQLGEANALEQVARPLALRLAGPAVGGVLVGVFGLGAAFFADAATFMVSAATLWSMSARASASRRPAGAPFDTSVGSQLREGWSYVRRHVWLWGTFASAGVAYLLFMGPAEVLLPFMVKHELGGSGVQLGLVLAAGDRLRRMWPGDGSTRAPLAGHHLYLRRLDARDHGGGGVRTGHGNVAIDAGQPRLQPA